MATQVFHLEIPSNRIDLIDMAKLISRKVASLSQANTDEKTLQADKGLKKTYEFCRLSKRSF